MKAVLDNLKVAKALVVVDEAAANAILSTNNLKEARGVLASISGNITSNRPDEGEDRPVTCMRDNMAEIKETAMQIREIARNINMALFNE